jgi:hypothetical protein
MKKYLNINQITSYHVKILRRGNKKGKKKQTIGGKHT